MMTSGDVHVWVFPLMQLSGQVNELALCLSAPERIRSERFYFDHLKRRFIVRHAFLRHTIARYLSLSAPEVKFDQNAYGKPRLSERDNHADLRFNLSSSGEWGVLACMYGHDLGIDVEEQRFMVERDQLVSDFFSEQEVMQWKKLSDRRKDEAFFIGWTRKEAYIKALGLGLFLDLKSFSVSFDEHEDHLLSGNEDKWRLVHFLAAPHYRACVACPEEAKSLSFFHISEVCGDHMFKNIQPFDKVVFFDR
ncbi:MAG: 4'-phosphopantetheinyl transferase family protein [Terasakiella sp.]|uniref:4'-phosphopantetheinyl transferase family protein n=1 Tax=unclassified Terasakiella TaxID=2614952 RepID=UPI003AFFD9E4